MLFHLTESTYHSLKVSIDPVSTLSSENSQKKALCSPDYCPPSHLTVFLEKALYLCDDITSNDKKTWRNSRHCRCSMDVSEHASFLYRHGKLNLLLQPLGNRIPVECHCTSFWVQHSLFFQCPRNVNTSVQIAIDSSSDRNVCTPAICKHIPVARTKQWHCTLVR